MMIIENCLFRKLSKIQSTLDRVASQKRGQQRIDHTMSFLKTIINMYSNYCRTFSETPINANKIKSVLV